MKGKHGGGSGLPPKKVIKKPDTLDNPDTNKSNDQLCKYSSSSSLNSTSSSSSTRKYFTKYEIESLSQQFMPDRKYVRQTISRLNVLSDLVNSTNIGPLNNPIKDMVFLLHRFLDEAANGSGFCYVIPNLIVYDNLICNFTDFVEDNSADKLKKALNSYTIEGQSTEETVHLTLTQLLKEMGDISANTSSPSDETMTSPCKKRNRSESSDSLESTPPPIQLDDTSVEQECKTDLDIAPKPELIYAKVTGDWLTYISGINAVLSSPPIAIFRGDSVSLQVQNADDHFKLVDYLSLKEIQHSAPPPKNMRPKKVVLRGLPSTTNTSDIIDELARHDFTVTSAVSMLRRATKDPLNLFLLDITPTPNFDSIFNIKYLMHLKVKFTQFRASRAPQCHACQRFFHHSNSCNFLPRCVKCGGDHTSSGCVKPRTDPAKCANCGGNHTANYLGCKMNPSNRFSSKRSQHPKQVVSKDTIDPPLLTDGNFPPVKPGTRMSNPARKNSQENPKSYASATKSNLSVAGKSSDGEKLSTPSGDLLSVIGEIQTLCSVYKISDILTLLKEISTAVQSAKSPEEKLAAILTPIFNFLNSKATSSSDAGK